MNSSDSIPALTCNFRYGYWKDCPDSWHEGALSFYIVWFSIYFISFIIAIFEYSWLRKQSPLTGKAWKYDNRAIILGFFFFFTLLIHHMKGFDGRGLGMNRYFLELTFHLPFLFGLSLIATFHFIWSDILISYQRKVRMEVSFTYSKANVYKILLIGCVACAGIDDFFITPIIAELYPKKIDLMFSIHRWKVSKILHASKDLIKTKKHLSEQSILSLNAIIKRVYIQSITFGIGSAFYVGLNLLYAIYVTKIHDSLFTAWFLWGILYFNSVLQSLFLLYALHQNYKFQSKVLSDNNNSTPHRISVEDQKGPESELEEIEFPNETDEPSI